MVWSRVYAAVWWRVTAVVVAVGALVCAAMLAFASPMACAVALTVPVVAVLVKRAHGDGRPRPAGPPIVAPEVWRAGAVMLAGGGCFLVSAIGWDAVAGAAGDLVVVTVALAGAPLVCWEGLTGRLLEPQGGSSVRRQPQVARLASVTPAEPVDPAEADERPWWPAPQPPTSRPESTPLLPSLTDDELWHAWHASTRALRRATSPGVRLRIVAVRELYLDALVQRDPDGFARQIEVGPDSP